MSEAHTVLILRTISVEKLDGVLNACRDTWPEAKLVVLTNPGRKAELEADARIAEVLTVDLGASGFDRRLRVGKSFDTVVVPIGNRNGSGYANVLQAARQVRASHYYVAAYARDLRPMSRMRLTFLAAWENTILALCLPLAWVRVSRHRW